MKTSNAVAVVAGAGLLLVTATSTHASLTWSAPISLGSPDIVGYASGLSGRSGKSETTEQAIAQELINLGANFNGAPSSDPFSGQTYTTSATSYSGTLDSAEVATGKDSVPSGYQYAIAIYKSKGSGDGVGSSNVGYILFYLGGQAATLPESSADLLSTGRDKIIGFTAFNAAGAGILVPDPPAPTPEPATIFAGALILLPFGASVLRSYRKRK